MTGAWRFAARNLTRNRRRNIATVSAIAIGFSSLVLLGGYVVRVEHYTRVFTVHLQHRGHVAVYQEGGFDLHLARPSQATLDAATQAAVAGVIAGDPEVEFMGATLEGTGLLGNGCVSVPFIAHGVDLELERRVRSHPQVARWVPDFARPLRGVSLVEARDVEAAVTLSEGLARKLGKRHVRGEVPAAPPEAIDCAAPTAAAAIAGDTSVQLAAADFDGQLSALDGDVVGLFSTGDTSTDDYTIWTSLATLQRLYVTDRVTALAIFLEDPGVARDYARRLGDRLREKGLRVEIHTYDDERFNPFYAGTLKFLIVMSAFILLLVVTAIVLSILNSMTMTIIERSRELGTLRSLGFTRRQIMGLLQREAVLLTLIGLGLGLLLGLGASALINALDLRFQPPQVARPIQFLLVPDATLGALTGLFILALAIGATWVAGRRRVRMRIAELNTALTG